jgi:hypothetical protein
MHPVANSRPKLQASKRSHMALYKAELGNEEQGCLTPASSLGLLQPAAAFVQAACCQTTSLKSRDDPY